MRSLFTGFRWGFTGEVQSLLVEDGIVVDRGVLGEVAADAQHDLTGGWLMPGLIDAHCHVLPTGLDLQKLHLGGCHSPEAVLATVAERNRTLEPDKWLLAVHYDQNRFPDGLHLSRHDLDRIASDRPILLRHVNGHASVANSRALQLAGVAPDEPDPNGGSFGRDASGELTGVLFEAAHERVSRCEPKPSLDEMVEAILAAGRLMASRGVLCASDMMTGRYSLLEELTAYHRAAEQGNPTRIRLYLQWGEVFGPRAVASETWQAIADAMDQERCRVAGIKIFADGAIGSATAAIYGTYSGEAAAGPILSRNAKAAAEYANRTVSGQLIYAPERLKAMVRTAHEAGYPIAIHSIGDYSTDLVMDAYQELGDANRHRIEHAMILSDEQITRMAKLGCSCTMQPEFLVHFGQTYRRQLGPERARRLKRMRSIVDAGIPLSLNSDMPIVSGDPWLAMRTATNRPEGFDPQEALSVEEALIAYSAGGAAANRDAHWGSLSAGQPADFFLSETDPRLLNPVGVRPYSNALP